MNQTRIKCPYCGEDIAATAKKCRFCGEWLPTTQAEQQPMQQPQPQQTQQPVNQQTQIQQPAQPLYPQTQYQQPLAPVSQEPPSSEGDISLEKIVPNTFSFFDAYFVTPYFRHYADFKGVTSRKSFWLSMLALLIVNIGVIGLGLLLSAVANVLVATLLWGIWSLALVIPGIAIGCRRLRDAGKSPLMYLLSLIPLVGPVILLVFWCKESQYDHSDENVAFKPVDIAVLAGCVVLLIGGFFALRHSLAQPSYNVTDDDLVGTPVEEVDTFASDTAEVVSEYSESNSSTNIGPGSYYLVGNIDDMTITMNLRINDNMGFNVEGTLENSYIPGVECNVLGSYNDDGTLDLTEYVGYGEAANPSGTTYKGRIFRRPDGTIKFECAMSDGESVSELNLIGH